MPAMFTADTFARLIGQDVIVQRSYWSQAKNPNWNGWHRRYLTQYDVRGTVQGVEAWRARPVVVIRSPGHTFRLHLNEITAVSAPSPPEPPPRRRRRYVPPDQQRKNRPGGKRWRSSALETPADADAPPNDPCFTVIELGPRPVGVEEALIEQFAGLHGTDHSLTE